MQPQFPQYSHCHTKRTCLPQLPSRRTDIHWLIVRSRMHSASRLLYNNHCVQRHNRPPRIPYTRLATLAHQPHTYDSLPTTPNQALGSCSASTHVNIVYRSPMLPTCHRWSTHYVPPRCAQIASTLHPVPSPRRWLPHFLARNHGDAGAQIPPPLISMIKGHLDQIHMNQRST